MLIGVPKEIKDHEYRVSMIPSGVHELITAGHQVYVERDAGAAIGLTNEHYQQAGATIIDTAEEIYAQADMIVKVKEPQACEYPLLRPKQILFTFLHLAANPELEKILNDVGVKYIAYEEITDDKGRLPILAPMSEIAGRMSIQIACHAMENTQGGPGILMGGVPGVSPAKVVVLGGGVVGTHSARMAMGFGADVTIIDKSADRLRQLDDLFGPRLKTLFSNQDSIGSELQKADVVIGSVLIPGEQAPKLVTREMVQDMKQGAVIVDVAIDQGGCFETSRPTFHSQPTYTDEGVIHYCVPNIPGIVAWTATFALTNVTLPYVRKLASETP